jgi:hypothetical protein
MDIFESTLRIKDFIYDNNNSLIRVRDDIELSNNQLPLLYFHGEIETIDDYYNKTKLIGFGKGLYNLPNEFITAKRNIDFEKFEVSKLLKNTPDESDTKEYWNFLHEEFQYCDVMTYPIYPNLTNYFATKGPLYDAKINLLPRKLQFFKNKKILEIGGGYGYLPRLLKSNKIKHTYYHADIVKRFDCDNFIDLNGYSLSDSIFEKFDVILMFDVFGHLNLSTIYTYFKEFKSLLNEKGHILINTQFLDKEKRQLGTFFAQTYIHPSENEFIKLLEDNQYAYQKFDYYCYNKLEGCFYDIINAKIVAD